MSKNMKHKAEPMVKHPLEETACKCGDACTCRSHGSSKLIIKSGVTIFSALMISGAILAAADIQRMFKGSASSRQATEAEIRTFIQKNPKLIADTMETYYKAQQAKKTAEPRQPQFADKKLVEEILADKTNYSLGNPDGKFVIIEFFDYQCGWCKRTNEGISKVLADNKAPNIRWVLIDTPIFGEKSEMIARYVLAAGKQGKFAEMHHAVSALKGTIDKTALLNAAKSIKINTEKLQADADSDEIKGKLESNKKYADTLKISGVPFLIVDGKINPGALIGKRLDEVVKLSNQIK